MLVDINLLPKKQPKNVANHLTLLLSLIGLIVVFSYFFGKGRSMQSDITNLNLTTTGVETEIMTIEQELKLLETANLEMAVQTDIIEILNETIYAGRMLMEAKKHLPENAVIESYDYTEKNSLTFSILIDESRDIGTFVESISTEAWVDEANVESVSLDTSGRLMGRSILLLERDNLFRAGLGRRDY